MEQERVAIFYFAGDRSESVSEPITSNDRAREAQRKAAARWGVSEGQVKLSVPAPGDIGGDVILRLKIKGRGAPFFNAEVRRLAPERA